MPVSRARLGEVLDLLEQPAGQAAGSEARVAESAGLDAPEWDAGTLRALASSSSTPRNQKLVLKMLAERAGETVTAPELQAYLLERGARLSEDYPGRAVGAIIKALTKRSAYQDGRERPFDKKWDAELGNYYVMPEEYGPVVLAALGELDESDS